MGVLFRLPDPQADRPRQPASTPLTAAAEPPTTTSTRFRPSRYAPPANTRRTLTAAGQQIRMNTAGVAQLAAQQVNSRIWQTAAFDAYENVGELSYAFNLVANILSRLRLYVGAYTDPGRPPAPVDEVRDLTPGMAVAATAALDRLAKGSNSGISGLLYDMAVNISVTGECYLVQTPGTYTPPNPLRALEDDEAEGISYASPATSPTPVHTQFDSPNDPSDVPETWSVRSVEEVVVTTDSRVYLRPSRTAPAAPAFTPRSYSPSASVNPDFAGTGATALPPDAYVGRIFRASARFSEEPFSSVRAVLPIIDEMVTLNQMFRATALSRLNAGLLYLPDGLSVSHNPPTSPPPPPLDLAPTADPVPTPLDTTPDPLPLPFTLPGMLPPSEMAAEEDTFEEDLIDAMTTPIQDPSSASAVVPLVVRGPRDLGEKIRHITFERTYDDAMVARADRLLERMLQGIDLPKDVVTGLANVRYSNAIQIEESLLRAHIEPLALLICDALTTAYLHPYLTSSMFTPEQAERVRIWYDAADVVNRPNRTTDADNGYDRHTLSASSWRRAHGFDETAKPDPAEMVFRMLLDKGQISPEFTETLLKVIAPLVMEQAREANAATSANPLPPEVAQALGLPPSAAPVPADGSAPPADNLPPPAATPTPTPPPPPLPTTPTPGFGPTPPPPPTTAGGTGA